MKHFTLTAAVSTLAMAGCGVLHPVAAIAPIAWASAAYLSAKGWHVFEIYVFGL